MLAFLALFLAVARAAVNPTEPSSDSVYNEGATCTIRWDPDTTGTWTETYIQLMTGDNWNMVHLTTIHQFDGTDPSITSFEYPCPNVEPNAKIYFYQFTSPGQPAGELPQWTTRWTLANEAGEFVDPPETTQPDGQLIGWGIGRLEDPSQATPPPPSAPQGQAPSGSSGPSSSPVAPSSTRNSVPPASSTPSPTSSRPLVSRPPTSSRTSASSTPSASGSNSAVSTGHSLVTTLTGFLLSLAIMQ